MKKSIVVVLAVAVCYGVLGGLSGQSMKSAHAKAIQSHLQQIEEQTK